MSNAKLFGLTQGHPPGIVPKAQAGNIAADFEPKPTGRTASSPGARVRALIVAILGIAAVVGMIASAHAQIAYRSAASAGVASVGRIAYLGAGNVASTNSGSCPAITPTVPAGTVGDLLIAFVSSGDNVVINMTGWNAMFAQAPAGNYQAKIFWRIATGTDASTITRGASSGCNVIVGRISRFSGIDAVNPVQGITSLTTLPGGTLPGCANPGGGNWCYQNNNTITTGTQTTIDAEAMLVLSAHTSDNSNITSSAPAGFTFPWEDTTTSGNDASIAMMYALQSAAGTYGSYSFSKNRGSDPNHGVLFALRPSRLTINRPAGTVANDVMIASISVAANTLTPVAPAGWTVVRTTTQPSVNTSRMVTYYRVAGGSEPASYDWTFTGTGYAGAVGGILSFSGVDISNPIDMEGGVATPISGNHTTPTITTITANTMLVGSFEYTSSTSNWTPPAGMTEAVDRASQTAPNNAGISLEMTYEARTAAGATGTRTASANITGATADAGIAHMLALRSGSQPPALVSATVVCGVTNQVEVLFSQAVTAATAQNAANYALNGGATVASAVLGADPRIVTLTTSTLASQLYTLTVNNVANSLGQTVPANSQATFYSEGGYLSGLLGTYYGQGGVQRAYFTGATVTRVDGPLDFDWGGGIPVAGIGADDFSVIWNGFVTPLTSGNYTFRTRSDDGVRLYFDGNAVPIIDNWTDHGPTNDDSAVIALNAGQRYAVRMEFYERGGGAVAQLLWSGPSTGGFQFIPRSSLSHFCGLPRPAAFYTMDETSWNGTSGEVVDSSGNGRNGTAVGGAVPTFAKVCNGAQLNGASRYVTVGGLSGILNGTASLAFWIKTTQTGNDTGWQAPGVTGVELGGGADDIFWGWLDAGGRIGISVANDFSTKSTVTINDGTWRHVVLTRDHIAGTYKIYIDGNLNTSGALTGGIIGTPFSSIGRIDDTGGSPEYLDGQLDEVRIYSQVLSDSEVIAVRDVTRPCAAVFNHIRIEHDGTALTCQPETVTVRACADALCTTTYTGTVQTTLTPTGWVGGDSISFSGGSTTAQLRRSTAGIATLGAGSISPAPIAATRCFNGATETCSLDYRTSGFIFDVPNLTSCKPFTPVTITAVRADDTSQKCVPAFESGTRLVNFWSTYSSPATGSLQVEVNGAAVATSAPGTGVNLTFAAGAVSNFSVRYPDAGQMQLHARYTGSGAEAGLVMDGVDTFVAVPVGMAVVPTGGACVAGDASCAAYRRAGASFNHQVQAACWTSDADTDLSDNPVTPNFQMAGIPLSAGLVAPSGGVNATLGTASVTLGSGDNGTKIVSQNVNEVGVFTIAATPSAGSYFGLTVPAGVSPNIGRFTPDHYFLSGASTLTTRAAAACIPASSFTYMDERFGVALTLQARNTANQVTQNYGTANGFAKLDPTNISQLGFGARSAATLLTSRLDLSAGSSGTFSAGSAAITATLGVRRAASPDGPYTTVQLGIVPTDSDGITISGPDFDGDGIVGNERRNLGVTTEVRFGRLRIENVVGASRLDLPLRIQAQYYSANGFVTNTDDSCTRFASSDIAMNFVTGAGMSLEACETAIAPNGPVTLSSGAVTGLRLRAPGIGNKGAVDLRINLSSASGNTCTALGGAATSATASTLEFLRGNWAGTGTYDQDPPARATFGIYKNANEFIYFQENF